MTKYFSTLIKPASSLCNMRCKYCFYADVSENRVVPSYGVMSAVTSEQLIDRFFEVMTPPDEITFAFQGGEPTVAGLTYFEHFTAYAEKANAGRFSLHYAIQTNGLVLDENWCRFFKKYHFLVGVSLDGDESLHDFCRLDAGKQGTYARIRKNIRLLERNGVDYNILSVITRQMAKHPAAQFKFYERNQFRFLQLIPCLKPLGEEKAGPFDLTPRLYASFLKQFFTLWYESLAKGRYISVRQFDNIARLMAGLPPEQCGMLGFCSPQFVIEADGGVYPCDFYVLDQLRMGNIREDSFFKLEKSPVAAAFRSASLHPDPACQSCRWVPLCRGGCRRDREPALGDQAGLNKWCSSYQALFVYAYPRMLEIARAISSSGQR